MGREEERRRGSACGAGRRIAFSVRRARGRGDPHGDGAGEAAGRGARRGQAGRWRDPVPREGSGARTVRTAPPVRAAAAGRAAPPGPPGRSWAGRGAGNGAPMDRGLPAPPCPHPCLPAPLLWRALLLRDAPCPLVWTIPARLGLRGQVRSTFLLSSSLFVLLCRPPFPRCSCGFFSQGRKLRVEVSPPWIASWHYNRTLPKAVHCHTDRQDEKYPH